VSTSPRPYNSPIRQERAAQTRDRIVSAGAELAHSFKSWDWRDLTVRAVAEQAGVNERTIYRHFATERELRDAILGRLQEEAGVSVDTLELHDFAQVTARVISYLSTFAVEPKVASDPTFVEIDQRRRAALVSALESRTPDWSESEQQLAAALLDVFWSVPTYERMRGAWGLSEQQVTDAISWVISLIEDAIADGRHPHDQL
jgi:AcrR family transcriptional regulator